MSFLDNITDMAKTAMGTVSSATAATTLTTSLTKIAEEIQVNPMAMVQNPMGMVDKIKEMIPMNQLKQASGAINLLPLPQEVKDSLTKLIDMATKSLETPATQAPESTMEAPEAVIEAPAMETPAVEMPAMPTVEAPAMESDVAKPAGTSVDM